MKIAVTTIRESNEILNDKAKAIAKDLSIPYIKRKSASIRRTIEEDDVDYLMIVEKDRITLKNDENTLFWHPSMAELKIKSILQGEKVALLEATKLEKGNSILDCTLGLASDSLIFSALVGKTGFVIGTEINKYIAFLTKNGLENYRDINGDRVENIKIINESYETYLKTQRDSSFDVVYFDPMFKEPNKKSTSINSFRDFAAHNTLTKEIIREAIRVCKKRVVIKERRGINNFEDLGIGKVYGGKKKGSIIYGIIEKHIID